jgi:hypothetical protein
VLARRYPDELGVSREEKEAVGPQAGVRVNLGSDWVNMFPSSTRGFAVVIVVVMLWLCSMWFD